MAVSEISFLRNAVKIYADAAMSSHRLQRDFFSQMADPHAFRVMFDHLPGVYFFVKDLRSRIIAASSTILDRLQLRDESEFVGTIDGQFFPPEVAAAYIADDQRVFATGRPIVDRLEIWLDKNRNLEWCLTTKIPLHGRNGRIIGLMGMTRRDERRTTQKPAGETAKVLDFLRENTSRVVDAAEIARKCGMSERTVHRKVKQEFGVTPYELSLRVRVQKAAEAMLRSRETISDIATAHGFCDQSNFTQHFRRRLGITPKQFRLLHSKA
jgi:AraC-like DNA-binding protein